MNIRFGTLRRLLSSPESIVLGAALVALASILAFLKLADALAEAKLGSVDRWLLGLVRHHLVHSSDSIVAEVASNLTALGGYPVLIVLMAVVTGFLMLSGVPYQALYAVGTTVSGALVLGALKNFFMRARPTAVEPLIRAEGWSFPSGHAFSSTVVYLTLGALLASNVRRRRMKLYVLFVSLLLSALVGISRILLGVHYPSDVLAGWVGGMAWALLCWLGFELLVRRRSARASPG